MKDWQGILMIIAIMFFGPPLIVIFMFVMLKIWGPVISWLVERFNL